MTLYAKNAQRRAEIVEDVAFMLETREDPDRIAQRLGTTREMLARRMHRWGEHELARQLDRVPVPQPRRRARD